MNIKRFFNAGESGKEELFRGKGKTDVCIPFENRSAFIAECKLWKSEKYIDEGINLGIKNHVFAFDFK